MYAPKNTPKKSVFSTESRENPKTTFENNEDFASSGPRSRNLNTFLSSPSRHYSCGREQELDDRRSTTVEFSSRPRRNYSITALSNGRQSECGKVECHGVRSRSHLLQPQSVIRRVLVSKDLQASPVGHFLDV